MGHMIHRAETRPFAQKVFFATPAYSGVEAGYAFALFESCKALEAAGIGSELALFANDCHVDDSRNRLVRQFLMTDCTDLVFLDADLRWEAKDLVNLLSHDVDVVGATYPLKQEKEGFPVMHLDEPQHLEGLTEVAALPTGFLRIRRNVFERLAADAPQYFGKADNDVSTPLIFERTLEGKIRWGGDYTFCKKWRATGGKIYLMPEPIFEHIGSKIWTGSYGHFVRKEAEGSLVAGLNAIREGRETNETMQDMYEAWGNEWAGDGGVLFASVSLARGRKVLECGSGLSTLCMLAAGAEVHSLEHDKHYGAVLTQKAAQLLTYEEISRWHLIHAPLIDGWYDAEVPDVDMALVDGPPRKLGDRTKVSGILDKIHGPLLWDDYTPNDLPLQWHKLNERVAVGYSTERH